LNPRSAVPARTTPAPKSPHIADLRRTVSAALEELKAREVREIDVRGKTGITDYMVIASGTSNRHVKAISDEVLKQAKLLGVMPLGTEGEREGEWVLVDLGDIVVHVMLPRVREFYGLERLWTVGDQAPEDLAGSAVDDRIDGGRAQGAASAG
jgi:ribosome-associated protein